MKRTKLKNRILPAYTIGEDLFNCISHITGGAFGVLALTLCVIRAALRDDAWAIVSVCIYGVCMIALGVIGFYIGRIYDEIKRRPRYIIAALCGETDET